METLLDAEMRIGELTRKIPPKPRIENVRGDSAVGSEPKAAVIQRLGFTPKQVERFETISKHPEIVE